MTNQVRIPRRIALAVAVPVFLAAAAAAHAGAFSDLVTSPAGLGQDLIGYWRLGESAGATVARDEVGYDAATNPNGNTPGTYGLFAAGDFGQTGVLTDDADTCVAYQRGDHQRVDLGDWSALNGATELTIAMWVKLGDLGQDLSLFTKCASFAGNQPILFWRDEAATGASEKDTFAAMITDENGNTEARAVAANGSGNTTEWMMVGFTFQAGQAGGLRIYVNGEFSGRSASTTDVDSVKPTTDAARIGLPSTNTDKDFGGLMDEVVVFDRALSAGEMMSLYQAVPEPASLVLLGAGGMGVLLRRRRRAAK